jgi:phosphoribulokinase
LPAPKRSGFAYIVLQGYQVNAGATAATTAAAAAAKEEEEEEFMEIGKKGKKKSRASMHFIDRTVKPACSPCAFHWRGRSCSAPNN